MSSTFAARPSQRPWGALALVVLATFATAAIGAYASLDAKTFYGALTQPAWAPPAAVFGPVWSVLYLMMGAAAWLVVTRVGVSNARGALRLYATQLVLNALWTWLFFHWHNGAAALAEVAALLAFVVATAVAFGRIRPLSGWLLLPYAAWVGFASALTLAMWRLNPGAL